VYPVVQSIWLLLLSTAPFISWRLKSLQDGRWELFDANRSKNAKLTCHKEVDQKLSLQIAKKKMQIHDVLCLKRIDTLRPQTKWYSLENCPFIHLKIIYSLIYPPVFKNLKARILKSITAWPEMGQSVQAWKVYLFIYLFICLFINRIYTKCSFNKMVNIIFDPNRVCILSRNKKWNSKTIQWIKSSNCDIIDDK